MGKRRKGPKVEWKVSIPTELALNLELLFYDEQTKRVSYGDRSQLVTALLEEYWAKLQRDATESRA